MLMLETTENMSVSVYKGRYTNFYFISGLNVLLFSFYASYCLKNMFLSRYWLKVCTRLLVVSSSAFVQLLQSCCTYSSLADNEITFELVCSSIMQTCESLDIPRHTDSSAFSSRLVSHAAFMTSVIMLSYDRISLLSKLELVLRHFSSKEFSHPMILYISGPEKCISPHNKILGFYNFLGSFLTKYTAFGKRGNLTLQYSAPQQMSFSVFA